MTERWQYVLEHGETRYRLENRPMIAGRSRKCDLAIADPSVSRQHAVLTARDGQILLEDRGSSNGTFVNGEQVTGNRALHHGDQIAFGDAELRIFITPVSTLETVRLPAGGISPEAVGDATSFLQHASVQLAQEALEDTEDASVYQTPPAPAAPQAPPKPPQSANPNPMATTRLDPALLAAHGVPHPNASGAPQPGAPQPGAPQPGPPQQAAPQQAAPQPAAPQTGGAEPDPLQTMRFDPNQLPAPPPMAAPPARDPSLETMQITPSDLAGANPPAAASFDPTALKMPPERDPSLETMQITPSELADANPLATARFDPTALRMPPEPEPPAQPTPPAPEPAPPAAKPPAGHEESPFLVKPPDDMGDSPWGNALSQEPAAPQSPAPQPAAPQPAAPQPAAPPPTTPQPAPSELKGFLDEDDVSPFQVQPPPDLAPPQAPAPPAPSAPPAQSASDLEPDAVPAGRWDPPGGLFDEEEVSPYQVQPPADMLDPEPAVPAAPAVPEFGASDTPSFDAPSFEAPSFEASSSEAPSFEAPSFDAPSFDAPSFEAPSFEAPSFEVPPQDTPSFEVPSLSPPAPEPSTFQVPSVDPPAFEAPAAAPAPPPAPAPPAAPPPAAVAYPASFAAPPPEPRRPLPSPPLEVPMPDEDMPDIRDLSAMQAGGGLGLDSDSELLSSLEGFDTTLGPGVEMPVTMQQAQENVQRRQEEDQENQEATAHINPYASPGAAATTTSSAAGGSGSVIGLRIAAFFLDLVWIGGLAGAAWAFGEPLVASAGTDLKPEILAAIAGGLGLLIMAFGWGIWGSSPGKRIAGLVVVNAEGEPGIGIPMALVRLLGYGVSAILLGLGFFMALGSSRQALHDILAKSHVVRR